MKKNSTFVFASALVLLFSSCSFEIPEKISIKTQAEYNFCLGKTNLDFTDDFKSDKMFNSTSTANYTITDYYPEKKDSKVQQYYMRLPLLEIPIDLSEYYKNTGLSQSIIKMSFSKDITIPSLTMKMSETIDMASINSTINAGMSITGPARSGAINFNTEFSEINYSSGSMTIVCSGIPDGTTVSISGSETRSGTFQNGVAVIDISDYKFIKTGMYINFSSAYADLTYVGTIATYSTISQAKGVTLSEPIQVPVVFATTIGASGSGFESCVVGSGNMSTNITIPESWQNIDLEYELTFAGGINVSAPRAAGQEKTIDLTGQTISSVPVAVAANIYLTLDNASFTSSINPKFSCTSDIQNFQKIFLTTNDMNLQLSSREKMSDAMLQTIKSIILGSCGLKGTFTNTLPEGNPIKIIASSDFLGLTKVSDSLASQTENGNFSVMSPSETNKYCVIAEEPAADNEYNSWDFTVNILLPGSTEENPSRFELDNVTPDDNYQIALSMSSELNWKELVITSADMRQSDVSALNVNLKSMFASFDDLTGGDFGNNVQLVKLPLYLYCTKPVMKSGVSDPFTDVVFNGSVSMFCGSLDDNKNKTISKDADGKLLYESLFEKQDIPFVSNPDVKYEDGVIVTDISKYSYSQYKDIQRLVNYAGDKESMYIDYDISFTNSSGQSVITITPDMLDKSASSASTLGISAVIIIPLQFKVTGDGMSLNIMELAGTGTPTSDIFGRSSATGSDSISNYMNIIRSASIIYESSDLPFYANPDMKLTLSIPAADINHSYKIAGDTITLDAVTMENLMSSYPIIPSVTLDIDKDAIFTVPRSILMKTSLSIQIVTDGSITLFGGDN